MPILIGVSLFSFEAIGLVFSIKNNVKEEN